MTDSSPAPRDHIGPGKLNDGVEQISTFQNKAHWTHALEYVSVIISCQHYTDVQKMILLRHCADIKYVSL